MLFRDLDRLFTALNVSSVPIALVIDVSPCALICYISAVGHLPRLALLSLSMGYSPAQLLGQVSLVWQVVILNGKVVFSFLVSFWDCS